MPKLQFEIDTDSETLAEDMITKLVHLISESGENAELVLGSIISTISALVVTREQEDNNGRELLKNCIITLQVGICESIGYPKAREMFRGLLGDGDD